MLTFQWSRKGLSIACSVQLVFFEWGGDLCSSWCSRRCLSIGSWFQASFGTLAGYFRWHPLGHCGLGGLQGPKVSRCAMLKRIPSCVGRSHLGRLKDTTTPFLHGGKTKSELLASCDIAKYFCSLSMIFMILNRVPWKAVMSFVETHWCILNDCSTRSEVNIILKKATASWGDVQDKCQKPGVAREFWCWLYYMMLVLPVALCPKKKLQEKESQGRNHWRCIVHGEPQIDVDWLGPPIKMVHPMDFETLQLLKQSSEDRARRWVRERHGKTDMGSWTGGMI